MNQKSMILELRKLTSSKTPFGNVEGKAVFQKLANAVAQNSGVDVFGISLAGIEVTDASFPRESVVSLAKQLRGEKGFYLMSFTNRDLIDNWWYAAKAKEQPLVIWTDHDFEIIGPEINQSATDLVSYVLTKGSVLASQAAADLNLSVPNASTRLKNLVNQGYLMRSDAVAESGGIEFIYGAIK